MLLCAAQVMWSCGYDLALMCACAYTAFMLLSPFAKDWLRSAIIHIISAGVASGLALNRRRNQELLDEAWPADLVAPCIQIVVPMRDEEENVRPLLATLLSQAYPSERWGITVVDDSSADDTARIVREMAVKNSRIRLVDAPPVPPGWTGKSNAMYAGCLSAPPEAEWLLFVDADTRHTPYALAAAVREAMRTEADLLSLVIDVKMETFWERVLVPQAGELYTLLVGTMDQVNSRRSAGAAANGQFMLVRRSIFKEVGQLPKVRGDVAEDRALAKTLKEQGYQVRMAYGRNLVRARVYSSLGDMWNGYTKTLFWASGHDTPRAIAVAVALGFYAFTPLVTLLSGIARRQQPDRKHFLQHAAAQIAPMLAVRMVVCRQMRIPIVYALTYPLGVAAGNAMLLYSMYRVLSGKGVKWRGRVYQRMSRA